MSRSMTDNEMMQDLLRRTREADARPVPAVATTGTNDGPPDTAGCIHEPLPDMDAFVELASLNPEFFELLHQMAHTHNVKSHDYCGKNRDPLANLTFSEEIGIPAWKASVSRMMDKWQRIKNFCLNGVLKVKGESFEDSLMDNAVYSLLTIILFRRARRAEVQRLSIDHHGAGDFTELQEWAESQVVS